MLEQKEQKCTRPASEVREGGCEGGACVVGLFRHWKGIRHDMEAWYTQRCVQYGIEGLLPYYIQEFLKRNFQVKPGQQLLESRQQHNWVPQGSIPSQSVTLFALKINSIALTVPNNQSFIFTLWMTFRLALVIVISKKNKGKWSNSFGN